MFIYTASCAVFGQVGNFTGSKGSSFSHEPHTILLEANYSYLLKSADNDSGDLLPEAVMPFCMVTGGGMYVSSGKLHILGHLAFERCNSFGSGGGLLVNTGGVHQHAQSKLEFLQCSALGADGGGASTNVEYRCRLWQYPLLPLTPRRQ